MKNKTTDISGIIHLLDYTDLFGGLSEKSKKMLAEIAIPKMVDNGDTIFSEGDKAYSVYLLGNGSVELSKTSSNERKVVIRVVQPGEMFGEVILFEQDQYPATATALRKSAIFILPKAQFHALLTNDTFRTDFFKFLMAKQRYLTSRISFLQSHEVDERFYLFIRDHFGKKSKIHPNISKKDIAAAIGTTPETLSRLIMRFKNENMLLWEGKVIIISEGFWEKYSAL